MLSPVPSSIGRWGHEEEHMKESEKAWLEVGGKLEKWGGLKSSGQSVLRWRKGASTSSDR